MAEKQEPGKEDPGEAYYSETGVEKTNRRNENASAFQELCRSSHRGRREHGKSHGKLRQGAVAEGDKREVEVHIEQRHLEKRYRTSGKDNCTMEYVF